MLQRQRIICAITFAFAVVLIDGIISAAAGRHVGSILPVYPRLQPLPDTVPERHDGCFFWCWCWCCC